MSPGEIIHSVGSDVRLAKVNCSLLSAHTHLLSTLSVYLESSIPRQSQNIKCAPCMSVWCDILKLVVVWIPVSTLSGVAVIVFTFGVKVLHLSMPLCMYLERVLSYLFIFFLLT